MLAFALLVTGAYLLGSVLPAVLIGKRLKGIDIREYGTGNPGGANVFRSVARWAVVPVSVFDVLKGATPVLIARHGLGFSEVEYMVVGLATVAGHAWPLYFRFLGGRGVATSTGVLLAGAERVFGIYTLFFFLGAASRQNALFLGLGLFTAPLWAYVLQEPGSVILGSAGLACIVALRRLQGSPGKAVVGRRWWEVALLRLFLDRDTKEREPWLESAPPRPQSP